MPRGGKRANAGRKPGLGRDEVFLRHVEAVEGDLPTRLSALAEDDTKPMNIRLTALRHLFSALAGRVWTQKDAAA